MTHSHAKLRISEAAYSEIREALVRAHYEHTIIHNGTTDERIDMTGIALISMFRTWKPEVFDGNPKTS